MIQKLILSIALIFFAKLSHCQIIDRYGLTIGASYSSQIWDYKFATIASNKEYKYGLLAFLHAEKDFGKLLALRTEIGYLQKGFKENIQLIFPDGTTAGTNNEHVILHDIALNLGLKIKPIKTVYAPYLLIGLQGNCMFSYKDIVVGEQAPGLKIYIYESIIEDFNKYNIGGLIGIGIDIRSWMYVEIEYNPNFTPNLNNTGLHIQDNCWSAKIGLYMNKLTE